MEMIFLFTAFDAGEIENVVDKAAESGGFGGDDAEIRALFNRIRDATFRKQF